MKPGFTHKLKNTNKRALFIKGLGVFLLIVGLLSLFLIPAEFTSLYSFSVGGSFHYEGFGFGSLMFTFIIFNVMMYLFLAFFGIAVGIGNLKLTKWGYNLSVASLKMLLVIGISMTVSILFSFDLFKVLQLYQYIILVIISSGCLILLPYSFLRFYNDSKTKQLFNTSTANNLFEGKSVNSLTIILINFLWILIFYLLISLRGTFPLLGTFIFTKNGTYLLSTAIFLLLILTYLFYCNKSYARAGMTVYYVLLLLTFTTTFLKTSTNDLLNLLNLPAYEIDNVVPAFRIPAGINLGIFFGVLIIVHLYLIFKDKFCSARKNPSFAGPAEVV